MNHITTKTSIFLLYFVIAVIESQNIAGTPNILNIENVWDVHQRKLHGPLMTVHRSTLLLVFVENVWYEREIPVKFSKSQDVTM